MLKIEIKILTLQISIAAHMLISLFRCVRDATLQDTHPFCIDNTL